MVWGIKDEYFAKVYPHQHRKENMPKTPRPNPNPRPHPTPAPRPQVDCAKLWEHLAPLRNSGDPIFTAFANAIMTMSNCPIPHAQSPAQDNA